MKINVATRMTFPLNRTFIFIPIALFFALFLCFPLWHVISEAFIVEGKPSLHNFWVFFSSPQQLQILLTSFNLAIGATLLATMFALPIVILLSQFRVPAPSVISTLVVIPLLLPPFVGALGMRRVFGRFGMVNGLFFGLDQIPYDWFGIRGVGVVVVQALHLYPLIFLALSASIQSLDPRLLEAAKMSGASRGMIVTRIVAPLLSPAFFSGAVLVFVASFTDLGTPLLFEYRDVLPVQIYNALSNATENSSGHTMVSVMAALNLLLFFAARRVFVSKKVVVDARSGRRPPSPMNGIAAMFCVLCSSLVITISLLPHVAVVLESFSARWIMTPFPEELTLANYKEVLFHPLTSRSLWNSLWLSSVSTALDVTLGFLIAYLIYRTNITGRKLLDSFTLLPLAIPGIVFAFGYLGAFAGTSIDPRRNPFPLLIAAYAVRRLPYMVRATAAGLQQANPILEEAAMSVGARWWQRTTRITLPILAPHILSGALLCFAFAILEVSDSLLLALEERYYPVTKALFALAARPDGAALASTLGVISILMVVACMTLAARFSGRSVGELFRQ